MLQICRKDTPNMVGLEYKYTTNRSSQGIVAWQSKGKPPHNLRAGCGLHQSEGTRPAGSSIIRLRANINTRRPCISLCGDHVSHHLRILSAHEDADILLCVITANLVLKVPEWRLLQLWNTRRLAPSIQFLLPPGTCKMLHQDCSKLQVSGPKK